MYFRKLLDLRHRNIDNFLDSLLWETCSLTLLRVAPRSMTMSSEHSLSVAVSVTLMAAITGSRHLRHTSVDGPCGSCSQFSDSLERRILLRAVVHRRCKRHGDRLLLVPPGTSSSRGSLHRIAAPSLRAAVGSLLEFIMTLTPRRQRATLEINRFWVLPARAPLS